MSRTYKRDRITICSAVLLLAIIGWFSHHGLKESGESADLVSSAHGVGQATQRVEAELSALQSEQRAYILTGEENFAAQYQDNATHLTETLATLGRLAALDPTQKDTVDEIGPLVAARLASMQKGMDLRRQGQIAAARDWVSSGPGQKQSNEIDILISKLAARQNSLSKIRESELAQSVQRARLTLVIGIAIAFGIVLFAMLLMLQGKKLREAWSQTRSIIETANDSFIAIDKGGVVSGWSPHAEELFGWSGPEMIGERVSEILRPPQGQDFEPGDVVSLLGMADDSAAKKCIEMTGVRRSGEEFPAELSVSATESEGQRQFNVFIRDISERKQYLDKIEEQNRELELRNREVERANQMKSQFLASMSHELRTPLSAIIGFSDLLEEGSSGPLNEKQQRFVQHIKKGGRHLLQLINDILDLSKIEAGQMELNIEEFDLQDVLPEVLSIVKSLAMPKRIAIGNPTGGFGVRGDRLRIKQIIFNLLSNAVKFTPEGGQVSVEVVAADELVRVSVRDSGIGISAEDQKVIFDEFKQVGETTRGIKEGTGLGLANTRRLVEQHGGTIWVESETGQGSCFHFTLPESIKVSAIPTSAQVEQPKQSDSDARLILVVDDEVATRELLSAYLDEAGYRVRTANSGREALELLRDLCPQAIVLDILMPDGNGLDCLLQLRQNTETKNIPVIVVSIVDDRGPGFALGAAEYIVKPVEKPVLLRALEKHLPSPRPARPSVLVVEDDLETRNLLSEMLQDDSWMALSAENGMEALKIISRRRVDAVVLDLLMPGMDGFEFLDRLQAEAELRDIPVIVLTAKSLTAEEKRLLERRTQAVLSKGSSWQTHLLGLLRKTAPAHLGAKRVSK